MKKIATKTDCENVNLPKEVKKVIYEIIEKLNFYYGKGRNVDADMGGYILLIETEKDIKSLEEIFHQPIFELTPEYVKEITAKTENFTNSLIICSSDYTIYLIIPLKITPPSFLTFKENNV